MNEDYQPYIVGELSRAPQQQRTLLELSASYNSKRNAAKALPEEPRLIGGALVLEKHGVVSIAGDVVTLNAALTGEEQKSIGRLCDQGIRAYNALHP